MQHTQAFAEDSAHRFAVDRQDLARAHDSHSLYDPALSGLWSYHQSSFTAPVNPSHHYPDSMNSHSFDQSSFSHHVSEPSSYNGDHQPLDANFALESPPTASNDFDFSAPPIDRASGPQRDLHNRRTAQIEATSAPYPVHRQLHESLSAGYPSTFPNSYTNLSNDIISPQPHDLYHAPGFVLGNDAGAHELTDTQAHTSTQQPSTNTRSRVRSSGSSQHGSRTSKRVRTPSPALTADSTLSAGSGVRRASPDDGKPGSLRVPTPLPPNKKGRLYNVDRRDICLYAQQNPDARQEDIARKWHVERSTISKILKNKDKWLKIKEDETILVAKDRSLKFGDIEDNMLRWVEECFLQTRPISDAMIYEEATRLRDLAHIDPDKFKVSPGWIENFKQRIGIRGGIWYGHGTKGKKLVAVGGEVEPVRWVGRTPDEPIFSPSAADAIQREGLYDVNTAIDIWFPGMSSFKYSSEDILRMVGASTYSEAYDRCQQWYQDHPGELAPWSEAQDFFKVVLDEEKAETAAVLTAELEARRRAVEARDAGEEFNFHDTFLRLVKDALRSVPEVDKRGHAFPIRPLDSHPDDVPHTQGPSAEDAHLAMMKVLSYVTMRDNIVTREQEQVLLSVWQSFCIMKDRDSRRLKRIKLVPEIANSDPFGEVISFMPPWAFLKPHIPDGPDSEMGSPL